MTPADRPTSPLRPVTRPRLYEQDAQQILDWVRESGLQVGDRLPPERELATRLGVSRATVSQALVAMEVVLPDPLEDLLGDLLVQARPGDGPQGSHVGHTPILLTDGLLAYWLGH